MPILEPQRCEARRSTGGPPCVGPVDAVRLETTHGPVIGCVLHSAILKTRSRHARLYPKTVAGVQSPRITSRARSRSIATPTR